MTSPQDSKVSLSSFADFVTAAPGRRLSSVQNTVESFSRPYEPAKDFYKQMRDAVRAGVQSGDDLLRVQRASLTAHPNRQSHYRVLADTWTGWRNGKQLEPTSVNGRWTKQGLTVTVTPAFVYRPRTGAELVYVHMKDSVLSRDAVSAITRLMELTLPSTAGRPAVLDLRTGRLHHARGTRRRHFDVWLESEAAAFTLMFQSLRAA